ncbi:MAG: hypothetical protein LC799_34000, partial [Actinobacteria bacterium]|nr:hypothetical protein [Actinomycetota bacterium]
PPARPTPAGGSTTPATVPVPTGLTVRMRDAVNEFAGAPNKSDAWHALIGRAMWAGYSRDESYAIVVTYALPHIPRFADRAVAEFERSWRKWVAHQEDRQVGTVTLADVQAHLDTGETRQEIQAALADATIAARDRQRITDLLTEQAPPLTIEAATGDADVADLRKLDWKTKGAESRAADEVAKAVLLGRYRYNPGLGWFEWDRRRWDGDETVSERVSEATRQFMDQVEWDYEAKAAESSTAAAAVVTGIKARLSESALVDSKGRPVPSPRLVADHGTDIEKKAYKKGVQDGDAAKTQADIWLNLLAAGKVAAVTRLCQGMDGILTRSSEFDSHPDLLNCRNCVVDLRDKTTRPHDPDLLITHLAGGDYDPTVTSETWNRARAARRNPRGRAAQYSPTENDHWYSADHRPADAPRRHHLRHHPHPHGEHEPPAPRGHHRPRDLAAPQSNAVALHIPETRRALRRPRRQTRRPNVETATRNGTGRAHRRAHLPGRRRRHLVRPEPDQRTRPANGARSDR